MGTYQNLNILYINIRSLRNKLDDLNDIVYQNKNIHIIILTETWIYANEEQYFNIDKFKAVHNCRNTRGGGASIYIREEIAFIENDMTAYNFNECNIVSLKLVKQKLTIFGVYRPPQNNIEEYINELDKLLENQKETCILIGDINLDLLKDTQVVTNYKNTIDMNGFQIQNQLTSKNATRITQTSASIIDHIITNHNLTCDVTLEDHIITDHKIICTELKRVRLKMEKVKITRSYLEQEKWSTNVKSKILLEEVQTFKQIADIINEEKKNCTKEYTIKIKENNHWITSEFIKKIKLRDRLYSRFKKVPSDYTQNEFKKIKNEVNNIRKRLQKDYAETKFKEAQGDYRQTWALLNQICNKKARTNKTINHITDKNGVIISNDYDKATAFNKHFSSIGETLASQITNNPQDPFLEEEVNESIFLKPTDCTEIKNIILELKNKCAPGMDNVSKKDLLLLWDAIGTKIVDIVNKILEKGIYPEELKTAKVIPVYKKGAQDELNNYRPISLLSTFSKIVEKVAKSRMINFINSTFMFDKYQYGFQRKNSTLGATADLLDHISSELDKNKYVIAVFVDLQKAFDTVNIELMLEKLNKMGFRGICHNLLRTYSTERKQYTVVNSSNSNQQNVTVGVAQGSVLGPLQYLLYVHSLKLVNLGCKYFMFADDTVLVYSAENEDELEQAINRDLDLYSQWLCYNKLTINIKKTVYMIIKQQGKRSCNPTVRLNNQVLTQVTEYNYLGLIISNNLTWNSHINKVINKVAPIIGVLKRCSHQLNDNTRFLLYNSFIEPHFRYLLPCWGNASDYLVKKLKRLQNKSIKTLFKLNYFTPSVDLYKHYPFLSFSQLRTLEQSKLIYCVKNKLLETNTNLKQNKDYHNYNVRHKFAIRNTFARTKKKQDSPYQRGIQVYNEISPQVFEGQYRKVMHNLKKYVRDNIV